MILKFKSMKALEFIRCFKILSHIDKLRLTIYLIENSNVSANVNNELNMLKNQLTELDKLYTTTLVNFSKYKHLTFLSAIFMEISETDKRNIVSDIIDNLFKTKSI